MASFCVTECRLVLLVTLQASKSGEKVVGKRNSDFIWKTSRRRRCWTSIAENQFTGVRIQASYAKKGCGIAGC